MCKKLKEERKEKHAEMELLRTELKALEIDIRFDFISLCRLVSLYLSYTYYDFTLRRPLRRRWDSIY